MPLAPVRAVAAMLMILLIATGTSGFPQADFGPGIISDEPVKR
jgi:hypothetical protein